MYLKVGKTPEKRMNLQSLGMRLVCVCLVAFLLIGVLPMDTYAAWDGEGSASDSNAGQSTGNFWCIDASEKDIIGYRFSCYDSDGNKMGDSVDILVRHDM